MTPQISCDYPCISPRPARKFDAGHFDAWAIAADTHETDRFAATITAWPPAIEVYIATGATNARTEAANTTIKHIKRTGRGYRNNDHYQTRILLRSAHRARQHRLTSQGTTVNCE